MLTSRKKRSFLSSLVSFSLVLATVGCSTPAPSATQPAADSKSPQAKTEIFVSAAASMTDVLQDVKKEYETKHPEITLTYNFGGSGKLAQQIEQGAPSDLFISASSKDMKTLKEKSLIIEDSQTELVTNEMVLIAPKESTISIDSFEKITPDTGKQFAIGEPSSVPVGRYTEEALTKLGLWEKMKPNMVYAKDVRQVLTYVESGNAELGVVYKSDALTSDKIKILATAKQDWHTPIVYPAALVKATQHQKEAQEFLTFLTTDFSKAAFEKYGFHPVK
ncbi:molybdate ABC transporter substrate-binding protein [Brevibacillus laterosporus]|uniref:molybdate ABC transporter substrate-binding protein n=1 Tax=Brevibacillus laterosporus TaxID=1465 RepID=UPI00264E9441|nr:molybdate ABC transporter substrate-binding protein [Brevibacillus laterosporus]MDN9010988.1 molybdate ABC transporter substrate-binding protein [Brevibacillus laterosporus]MDO0942011.1 molybdate ABC transporter substrate-binding protein [Brevibacillus laterosporus]